jgi:PAS domain S-box-containing protein
VVNCKYLINNEFLRFVHVRETLMSGIGFFSLVPAEDFRGILLSTAASSWSGLLPTHSQEANTEQKRRDLRLSPPSPSHLFSWDADAPGLWKPENRRPPGISYPLQLALVFFLYFAAGRVGLAVPFTSANVSPVWPAAGVGMALVLIWGIRVAPAVAVAAFLVNFFSPIPTLATVGIGLGNASSAVVGAYLLRHLAGFNTPLARLRDVTRLIVFGALLAATVAAFVGVSALTLTHTRAWYGYASAWRIWWLGDAMGVLVIAPLILNGRDLLRFCRGWRLAEICLISFAVLVASSVIFGRRSGVEDDVLAFVVFPFVVWAAIRFRLAGGALSSLFVASIAVWGTSNGFGPFVKHSPLHNAVLLQLFIALTSLTGLVLAAVISEREHLQERVEEHTRELEEKTEQLANQAKLLDLANDAIIVCNAEGAIAYWSKGAERLYGWTKKEALGRTVHDLCHKESPADISSILTLDRWEGELQQKRRDGSRIAVASRWTALRDSQGKPMGWLQINTDITARRRAERAARSLTRRILSLEADERRRIARELHDSLGQYLTSLKINLGLLSQAANERHKAALLSECLQTAERCLKETRTISYLLHPPLLDEAGLDSAIRWYVDGFAQRSGIKVSLDMPPDPGRFRRDLETALFRVVQEALTNVHRHSGASAVTIRLDSDAEQVWLELKDNGKGIPEERLHAVESGSGEGVGLAGMRERVRELGGNLKIESSNTGTLLNVSLPIAATVEKTSAEDGVPSRGASAN